MITGKAGGFYAISLILISIAVWVVWDLCISEELAAQAQAMQQEISYIKLKKQTEEATGFQVYVEETVTKNII